MHGSIRCPVYPTEDQERVEKAVNNVFINEELSFEIYDNTSEFRLSFEGRNCLEWLRNRIHELRIIDAVRSRLLHNWDGSGTRLNLDKQVAYHGRIKILDDREDPPPLGFIEVNLEFNNEDEFKAFLRYFTPPTKDGRILN